MSAPAEYLIRPARDGGFYIQQGPAHTADSRAARGPVVFAGSLSDCLGYLRRRLAA